VPYLQAVTQIFPSSSLHWHLIRSLVSQNHRMFGVGRDLCGSSSPTPCRGRVTYSRYMFFQSDLLPTFFSTVILHICHRFLFIYRKLGKTNAWSPVVWGEPSLMEATLPWSLPEPAQGGQGRQQLSIFKCTVKSSWWLTNRLF